MQDPLAAVAAARVLTVSELNRRLRSLLEGHMADIWVAGEISNFRMPASGHFYFSLKDDRSQIAAVMFRSAAQTLPFRPRDGLDVIVRGRVSLYDVRGTVQLYAEAMEPRGLGALQLALQQLKERLCAEGLFDEGRKRPLPAWPRAVGIATALHGAAVHDMISAMRARMPQVRIVVRPVRVQGQGAGREIVAALQDLNGLTDIDVIIVGRGGGSLEDLWAFNEERVIRAICGSRAPVVSAVGHEIDFTLADLAADRRAATPTAAAALVVPDGRALAERLARCHAALTSAVRANLERARGRVSALGRHLRDPRQVLRAQRKLVLELGARARRGVDAALWRGRQRLQACAERLQALSPLAVLNRGYSITRREPDGHVIRSSAELRAGDQVKLTFAEGWARVRVDECGEG